MNNVTQLRDYLLIRRIRAGDDEAWEELVNLYYGTIYSYCFRRCYGQRQLAEDLTQEIFLKLIKNLERFQFTGKFFNYLFTIAVNTCNSYYQKKTFDYAELHENIAEQAENEAALKHLVAADTAEELQIYLDELPDMQREALILKYFHQLKVKEIAKITEVSVPTAQSRINQGLSKLKKMLDREEFHFE
ncbi:RNA polymerase sigma factor [Enterococcus sp. LJL90]